MKKTWGMAVSLSTSVTLSSGGIARVMGPARIAVRRGKVRILGIELGEGQSVVISRFRSYAVKALSDSQMDIVLGEGGSVEEPEKGEEVIDQWESVVEKVLSRDRVTLVVVGPVDSGKSTFTALVANMALSRGMEPVVIDGDVGQCDLAPPSFVAMARIEKPVLWLRELMGEHFRLVGYITPSVAPYRLLRALVELGREATHLGRVVVVNTDGWVYGYQALELKSEIARALNADYVVVLDEVVGKKLSRMLTPLGIEVITLPRPRVVRERDRDDRRYLRRQNYRRFFDGAKRICVGLDSINIAGSCVFSGEPLSEEELASIAERIGARPIMGSRHDDLVALVVERGAEPSVIPRLREAGGKDVYLIPAKARLRIVSAVLTNGSRNEYPALIDIIDPEKGLCLYTKYGGEVRSVIVGRVRISEEWEEVGKPMKCVI